MQTTCKLDASQHLLCAVFQRAFGCREGPVHFNKDERDVSWLPGLSYGTPYEAT